MPSAPNTALRACPTNSWGAFLPEANAIREAALFAFGYIDTIAGERGAPKREEAPAQLAPAGCAVADESAQEELLSAVRQMVVAYREQTAALVEANRAEEAWLLVRFSSQFGPKERGAASRTRREKWQAYEEARRHYLATAERVVRSAAPRIGPEEARGE